jgi:hypothetical protein
MGEYRRDNDWMQDVLGEITYRSPIVHCQTSRTLSQHSVARCAPISLHHAPCCKWYSLQLNTSCTSKVPIQMASNTEYLIVGAGAPGASTVLHLIHQKPWAAIILINRTPYPNPSSASHGRGKIVRADYADPFYMSLALESRGMEGQSCL